MMKINLYNPICNVLLRNIRNSISNRNICYIHNFLRNNNTIHNRIHNFKSPDSRFYSSVGSQKEFDDNNDNELEEDNLEDDENNFSNDNGPSSEQELREENESLKKKLSTLETKLKELELKYKMSLSNCDNLCKIHKKELENTKVYAVTEFAKGLLEVADTFELAFKHLNDSDSSSTDDFVDGIKMTENMLHQTFDRFGIKKYESLNEEFNPQVHEAMFEVKGQDSNNKVIQVVKNGYTISGRLLRPAKVGVSKK